MTSTLTNYTININVEQDSPLGRMLDSWARALDRAGPLLAAAVAAAEKAANPVTTVEEPAKRTRKTAVAAEVVQREPITPPAAPAAPVEKVELATLKTLAQDAINAVGLDTVKKILQKHGATRLSELDSKHYAAVEKALLEAKGALS